MPQTRIRQNKTEKRTKWPVVGRGKVQSKTEEEKKAKEEAEIEGSDNGAESETDNDEVHPGDVTGSVLTLRLSGIRYGSAHQV